MIAIVILGLGLIMVATMFPVAWQRARDMNEATVKASIVETAQTTAKLLLKVNGAGDQDNYGSFAGDLLVLTDFTVDPPPPPKNVVPTFADNFVHLLYMENLLVSGGYTPDRSDPSTAVSTPWQLGPIRWNLGPSVLPTSFFTSAFGRPQIRFDARVFPPMEPRKNVDVDGSFTGDDPTWENRLDAIRHGFAIFHRLRTDLVYLDEDTGLIDLDKAKIAIRNPRVFDIYYVTLRRPGATLRYARQDPDSKNIPPIMPNLAVKAVMPKALPAENDVLFPTPWRVQIYVPPQTPDPANPYLQKRNDDETGIPSEVFVNDLMFPTSEFVVDFFQPGTKFIDEANGKVYRVTDRRIETTPSGMEKAILTLDQEILVEDLDLIQPGDDKVDFDIDDNEALRNVWVFPPPLDGARLTDGTPIFAGKPPVVDIDVRSLTFTPR